MYPGCEGLAFLGSLCLGLVCVEALFAGMLQSLPPEAVPSLVASTHIYQAGMYIPRHISNVDIYLAHIYLAGRYLAGM